MTPAGGREIERGREREGVREREREGERGKEQVYWLPQSLDKTWPESGQRRAGRKEMVREPLQ